MRGGFGRPFFCADFETTVGCFFVYFIGGVEFRGGLPLRMYIGAYIMQSEFFAFALESAKRGVVFNEPKMNIKRAHTGLPTISLRQFFPRE
jgi:hypothetical protein